MGGSVARALAARDAGAWHVTAWSRSADGPRAALADGVVDAVAPTAEDAVAAAELVLLAASPIANVELVSRLGPRIAASGALLTDVTSAQGAIARAAGAVRRLRHVGGHPMAGVEARGYEAARADLFVSRPWILVPSPRTSPDDVDVVRSLALACGGLPLELDAATHDVLVAAISHLPLVVAAALAETVTSSDSWARASLLAAGGWRDATRVARGDPALGAGIAALNRTELLAWLDRFVETIAAWREQVATLPAEPSAEGVEALRSRLERVRASLLDEGR